MAEQVGEKTLEPTPHRRQQARQQGHVAKSHDLCSAATLLLGLMVLMMFGGGLVAFLADYCRQQLGGEPWLVADAGAALGHWNATLWGLAPHLLPILGLLCVAAIAVHVLQAGFLFLPDRLTPDVERIDPVRGMQRIFSMGNAARSCFGLLKTIAVLAVAAVVIYGQREAIAGLTGLSAPQLALQATQILLWTTLKIGGALLVLAVLDYAFQRWKHEQDLKMTPQELREEMRNLEGNPQIIARRKQMQRELAAGRSTDAMRQADVILTDSSGLAVAIHYDPDTMPAPTVIAKSRGDAGRRMRGAAEKYGVAVIENGPLLQSLYRSAAVHHPIPAEHYTAVAEVLTEVYERDETYCLGGTP